MASPDISERLGRIEEKLDSIDRAVRGNGHAGLEQRVSGLERWRAGIVAVLSFLVFAAGVAVAVVK
jgi:hypothetical protein